MAVYLGSNAVNMLGGQPSGGGGAPTLQTKSKTYTPTTSQQTESVTADSGYDGLDAVNITVNAMPSGTEGTPTASKGTVSNHQVSITPSVTNTSGYITGSTKTGAAVTVSASELVSGSETKTANGTYDVTNLAQLVVNVSGSGSSAWTKIAETSYQVSTTSTSAATVATWETGHSEIWTSDKIVYVRVRDTAGKRTGYFYGVDQFFFNYTAKNHPEYSGVSEYLGTITNTWRCDSSGLYSARYGYGSTGYGVYADCFYDDGRIRIRKRYNSNYTLTIDGTYKVEVYLLDPAGGTPIFE